MDPVSLMLNNGTCVGSLATCLLLLPKFIGLLASVLSVESGLFPCANNGFAGSLTKPCLLVTKLIVPALDMPSLSPVFSILSAVT